MPLTISTSSLLPERKTTLGRISPPAEDVSHQHQSKFKLPHLPSYCINLTSHGLISFYHLYSFNNITDIGQAIVTQASGDEDRKDESRFWDVLAQDDLFKKDVATDGGAGRPRRRNSGGMPKATDEDMGEEPPQHGERGRQQA